MKLVNAKLYEMEINRRMYEIWYDEKFQYYFGGPYRNEIHFMSADAPVYAFAVLNDEDELIGFIRYIVDPQCRVAERFAAVNFTDDKATFALALKQVITDCFMKFGMNAVEWSVICGNPIEKSYDHICEHFGGQLLAIRHNRATDMAGNLCNDKLYEITREAFLKKYQKDTGNVAVSPNQDLDEEEELREYLKNGGHLIEWKCSNPAVCNQFKMNVDATIIPHILAEDIRAKVPKYKDATGNEIMDASDIFMRQIIVDEEGMLRWQDVDRDELKRLIKDHTEELTSAYLQSIGLKPNIIQDDSAVPTAMELDQPDITCTTDTNGSQARLDEINRKSLKEGMRILEWKHTETGEGAQLSGSSIESILPCMLDNIRHVILKYRAMDDIDVITDPYLELTELCLDEDDIIKVPMDLDALKDIVYKLGGDKMIVQSKLEPFEPTIEDWINGNSITLGWTLTKNKPPVGGYRNGKTVGHALVQIIQSIKDSIPALHDLSAYKIIRDPFVHINFIQYRPDSIWAINCLHDIYEEIELDVRPFVDALYTGNPLKQLNQNILMGSATVCILKDPDVRDSYRNVLVSGDHPEEILDKFDRYEGLAIARKIPLKGIL